MNIHFMSPTRTFSITMGWVGFNPGTFCLQPGGVIVEPHMLVDFATFHLPLEKHHLAIGKKFRILDQLLFLAVAFIIRLEYGCLWKMWDDTRLLSSSSVSSTMAS